jgi:hypothetical protein
LLLKYYIEITTNLWWERDKDMKELTILKVKIGTLAGFYAVGFGIVGFILSLLYAMSSSLHFGVETSSVLKGLAFGITAGVAEVIFVTIMYAVAGAVTGFVHAVIFNVVSRTAGGVAISVKEQK